MLKVPEPAKTPVLHTKKNEYLNSLLRDRLLDKIDYASEIKKRMILNLNSIKNVNDCSKILYVLQKQLDDLTSITHSIVNNATELAEMEG